MTYSIARRGLAVAGMLAASLALSVALSACSSTQLASFQAELSRINVFANKYGPIIGRDLIMVSNILVQAECSPALGAVTGTTGNILNIVAPNSSSAVKVVNALNTNFAVAQQLCPLLQAIRGSVGAVPAGTPSQVVTATGS